jgi:hypothetical protein
MVDFSDALAGLKVYLRLDPAREIFAFSEATDWPV